MKTFTTLYKKTNTGAIQYWKIKVTEEWHDRNKDSVGEILTEYGQLNTDSPQKTVDYVKEGKNIGKKNETTAVQQAEAEAQAKHEKQRKKGYVESLEAAQAGELDELIEGGALPMLAQSYLDVLYDMRPGHENDPPIITRTKESKKIKFPALMQPKFDGIRCIAIVKDGKCTLWSRTRKPIKSVPHIVATIEANVKSDIVLDGELYNHMYKNDFEKIVSAVRKDEPSEESKLVHYHVYDIINDQPANQRIATLASTVPFQVPLVPVQTFTVADGVEADLEFFYTMRKQGYEGAMIRNMNALYVPKRSMDLQKLKEFNEDEFKIIGIEEGSGKLNGHVGAFNCLTKEGVDFKAKLEGDTGFLKQCFENHSLWQGKQMTVVYQGFGINRRPRFPVAKAIRDYE